MLKKLSNNSRNLNDEDFVALEKLKKEMEKNQSLLNSIDLTTYVYLQSALFKKDFKAIPDRKISSFVENIKSVAEKIGFDFENSMIDTKSIYNLSAIKFAAAIRENLNIDDIESLKIVDYFSSRNGSKLSLLINGKKAVSVNTEKFGCDSYLTNDLLNTLWDKDITPLWNLEKENKIKMINIIIDNLTYSINDEIVKVAIKNKLSKIIDTKINLDDIKTHFMESLIRLEQDSLNDGELKDVYSQKFYKKLTGNREDDNKISFEIIKNLKKKSPNEDLTMVFFDINNFKTLNDEYSHNVGDNVLKHISNQLLSDVGDKGIVLRRGGDEFVVVAPASVTKNMVEKEFSKERVEENNKVFNQIIGATNDKTDISLTCGVSKIPNNITEKNCSLILHQCDIQSDKRGLEHKPVSHYLNGSSRGEQVTKEKYEEAKVKLIKNLYDELEITRIDIWGKDSVVLSKKVVELNEKQTKVKIDKIKFQELADNGKYLMGIDKKLNEQLTKRRKETLSLK